MKSEENYRAEEIAEVKFLSRLVWSASSVQLGHLKYSYGGIDIKVGPKKSLWKRLLSNDYEQLKTPQTT